ncbi:MAG: hypothetical protein Q7S87_01010 [Agitococcus sp.]|nr:hypothetical protein [Agitococcus sp.]
MSPISPALQQHSALAIQRTLQVLTESKELPTVEVLRQLVQEMEVVSLNVKNRKLGKNDIPKK